MHSGSKFCISMCVPWELNPQPFAMLYHRNTIFDKLHKLLNNKTCKAVGSFRFICLTLMGKCLLYTNLKCEIWWKKPWTFKPRQQAVSAQIRPTSGPHGFHTGQMWAGSGPKLCCCLGNEYDHALIHLLSCCSNPHGFLSSMKMWYLATSQLFFFIEWKWTVTMTVPDPHSTVAKRL